MTLSVVERKCIYGTTVLKWEISCSLLHYRFRLMIQTQYNQQINEDILLEDK